MQYSVKQTNITPASYVEFPGHFSKEGGMDFRMSVKESISSLSIIIGGLTKIFNLVETSFFR